MHGAMNGRMGHMDVWIARWIDEEMGWMEGR